MTALWLLLLLPFDRLPLSHFKRVTRFGKALLIKLDYVCLTRQFLQQVN